LFTKRQRINPTNIQDHKAGKHLETEIDYATITTTQHILGNTIHKLEGKVVDLVLVGEKSMILPPSSVFGYSGLHQTKRHLADGGP
jgi:hypothetical protein